MRSGGGLALLLSLLLMLSLADSGFPPLTEWLADAGAAEFLPRFSDGGFLEVADLEYLEAADLKTGPFQKIPMRVRKTLEKALGVLHDQGFPEQTPPP